MIRHLDVSYHQELPQTMSELLLVNVIVLCRAELVQMTHISLFILILRIQVILDFKSKLLLHGMVPHRRT